MPPPPAYETWVEGGAPVMVTLPPPPTASGSILDEPTADVPTSYSKHDLILAQIDEWFTRGLAGIRQAGDSVGRKPDSTPKGATFRGIEGDRAVYGVPSGSYEFTARGRQGTL